MGSGVTFSLSRLALLLRFLLLALLLDRRFFVKPPAFQFLQQAFLGHLPLQCFQRFVDLILMNDYFQQKTRLLKIMEFWGMELYAKNVIIKKCRYEVKPEKDEKREVPPAIQAGSWRLKSGGWNP